MVVDLEETVEYSERNVWGGWMARDSKIENKNENRGIGVKWNVWDAHESSFPCYLYVVAA